MRVNGVKLDNRTENFIKELMGDVFMPDTRAESMFAKACAKYNFNPSAFLGIAETNAKPAPAPVPSETL